nr:MAG: MC156R [Molluscum contagiosum virus]
MSGAVRRKCACCASALAACSCRRALRGQTPLCCVFLLFLFWPALRSENKDRVWCIRDYDVRATCARDHGVRATCVEPYCQDRVHRGARVCRGGDATGCARRVRSTRAMAACHAHAQAAWRERAAVRTLAAKTRGHARVVLPFRELCAPGERRLSVCPRRQRRREGGNSTVAAAVAIGCQRERAARKRLQRLSPACSRVRIGHSRTHVCHGQADLPLRDRSRA